LDLRTLENTSSYAIEAVYSDFWSLIPKKYRLVEDDRMFNDLTPFYDPELTYDNRLHYKLTNIEYPKRSEPWFVITWNAENGLLKSGLTQRRFTTDVYDTPHGKKRCKTTSVDTNINFAIASNSMSALFELQENYLLKRREKIYCRPTRPHSILGRFTVSMNVMDSQLSKLSRDKGTLCYLFLQCRVDYPIVGMDEDASQGNIQEIYSDVDSQISEQVLVQDKIDENTVIPSVAGKP
jgi:hypothetical protein